jgi:hypothetical protein
MNKADCNHLGTTKRGFDVSSRQILPVSFEIRGNGSCSKQPVRCAVEGLFVIDQRLTLPDSSLIVIELEERGDRYSVHIYFSNYRESIPR